MVAQPDLALVRKNFLFEQQTVTRPTAYPRSSESPPPHFHFVTGAGSPTFERRRKVRAILMSYVPSTQCFRHTGIYLSAPPTTCVSVSSVVRSVNDAGCLHSSHVADSFTMLSAVGTRSNSCPNFRLRFGRWLSDHIYQRNTFFIVETSS